MTGSPLELDPAADPTENQAVRRAVRWYILWSILALAAIVAGVLIISNVIARDTALKDAERTARAIAASIVAPLATQAFHDRDPEAVAEMQQALTLRARDGSLAHVKLWEDAGGGNGRVLYADEKQVIGNTYPMEQDEYVLFGTTNTSTSVSDLRKAENASERSAGQLVEVYAGVEDAAGEPMLFEGYISTSELRDDASSLVRQLLPLTVGALLVLFLATLPLAISLARRVDRAQSERRRLLNNAVESSDLERRRIAQDLHDGVIQDLAGVGISLSSMSRQVEGDTRWRDQLDEAGNIVRRDVQSLRTLMTDIYPPDLDDRGLGEVVRELLNQQALSTMDVKFEADEPLTPSPTTARLGFRVVRESLRNVVKHSQASHVVVRLQQIGGLLTIEVSDDGVGFVTDQAQREGHLGLRLLEETVGDAGGQFGIDSAPGEGTKVMASLPL